MFDYLGNFPISADLLPQRLRSLLEPIGIDPLERVAVSSFTETECSEWNRETVHMVMAVVPDDGNATPVLHCDSVVAHGLPIVREKGSERDFAPSVSGHDYVVASWGSSLFFTYNLAEKVWMSLGLTPRCIGNEHQRLVYDDLSLPEFGVAEGEVSFQYNFSPSRDVKWLMSNEYLRKYLWLRGGRGVRQFFYQVTLKDSLPLRKLMNGSKFFSLGTPGSWLEGDLRETEGGLLLQVWATVVAVSCELCPRQTADGLTWPGVVGKVNHASANDIVRSDMTVYLDDRFLERYEQNRLYDSTPVDMHGDWSCSPSYMGQWSFSGCRRVGRNLIEVEIRDLYKGVPVRETLHAHLHAVDLGIVKRDLSEEHIVSKVDRFLSQMLSLGENLSQLGTALGLEKSAVELLGFSRHAVEAEGWLNYPQVTKLAQVASLDMTQQGFLARCKSVHEIWQKLPDGFLKQILEAMGVPRKSIASLGTLKLLQGLLNILARFDQNCEALDALKSKDEPDGWNAKNDDIAMLFVNYDLRIADAHDSVSKIVERLQDQGFDTATLHQGHGRALDFVLDGVISSFAAINRPLSRILARA